MALDGSSPTATPATRIGIIGLGKHTYQTWFNSLRWAPDHEVVCAVDIDPAKVEQFTRLYAVPASYTDHRAALAAEKLDAVIVQAGHAHNFEIIRDALTSGVHVFVEKTPVLSTAQADELIALQEQTGKWVMVGFNKRFTTGYVLAKKVTERAEFGDIATYHSEFHANPYDERAFLLNHIIHHLDLARWYLGEIRIEYVRRHVAGDRLQAFVIAFMSESGAIGTIHAASMLDELYPMERLELVGMRRNVIVDNVKSVTYNRPAVRKQDFEPFELDDSADALVWNPSHGYYPRNTDQGYENELFEFLRCIRAGIEPQPNLADSRRTLALVEDIDRMLADGSAHADVTSQQAVHAV
ncbi:Gfo/Idh/MocA family protein [Gryllotalpicola reticulitermitis]|uniref:Gfo/Idh/MocA family protein n=1 Tax=Gryllotalpicola reticulitermitis TaxID=1184153 RepID=A0ABV8Q3F7_9MICO